MKLPDLHEMSCLQCPPNGGGGKYQFLFAMNHMEYPDVHRKIILETPNPLGQVGVGSI